MEENEMKPSLIAIGGSAGSLQVLFRILALLPGHFDIPILLIIHRVPGGDSTLEDLLNIKSHLVAREVEEKEMVARGYLYVCPPDYHVLLEADHCFSLDDSEKINYSRPSLDVSFCSLADVYGASLMGIVLSGANADGAEGMAYIQRKGGVTIVQQPEDAQASYMPESVIHAIHPDYIFSGTEIGQFLASLA